MISVTYHWLMFLPNSFGYNLIGVKKLIDAEIEMKINCTIFLLF